MKKIGAALLLLAVINLVQAERFCCPEAQWEAGRNCTDGSTIRLDCPNGIYILDPAIDPHDEFEIKGDNLVMSKIVIPPHRYCTDTPSNTTRTVAFTCFPDQVEGVSYWRIYFYTVLGLISAFFLLITLLVYIVLPDLRDLQGKVLMCSMTSLFIAYSVLAIEKIPGVTVSDEACLSTAFTLYYFLMAAFFWLNLVAFNVWRSVKFRSFMIKENLLFLIYNCIGWGVPIVLLGALLLAHHTDIGLIKPNFGITACWFGEEYETWVWFYGPVACLLGLNLVYFGLTSHHLWLSYVTINGSKLKVLRFRCCLYLKLMLVMGITWIFEVLSFAAGDNWTGYWIVTDILNSLQGLLIFLLLVATRKRVKKLLAIKRPFGIRFPNRWAVVDDEELEDVLAEEALTDEEVELSIPVY